jgi:hypothetical protein
MVHLTIKRRKKKRLLNGPLAKARAMSEGQRRSALKEKEHL